MFEAIKRFFCGDPCERVPTACLDCDHYCHKPEWSQCYLVELERQRKVAQTAEGWQQFRAHQRVVADLHTEAVATRNPLAARLESGAMNIAAARITAQPEPELPPVYEYDEAFEGRR